MKLLSLLKLAALTAIIGITFTGCSGKPEPFNYEINNSYEDISESDKQQLLNMIIDKNSRLKYNSSGGCIFLKSYWSSYRDDLNNCFIINNSNIQRIDRSICRDNYGSRKASCNYIESSTVRYSDFINNLQKNVIGQEIQRELSNYQKFSRLYDKAYLERKEKLSKIKISLVDNTKILPKSIFAQLDKFELDTRGPGTKIDLYKSYVSPDKAINELAYKFQIYSSTTKNTVDRYKIDYKQKSYLDGYNKLPTSIIYEIDKVYFNYLPEKFIASDANIDVEVTNEPLKYSSSSQYIKIYNKTKEFIEIDTIVTYYDKNVSDNLISHMKRKISPKSYQIIKLRDDDGYTISRRLLVNDKNQAVNYGFAIGYKMVNENILKNLYKVNSYSIKDFK